MKILKLIRPEHWVKNIFVLAALVFGKKLFGTRQEVIAALGSVLAGFICFCLVSSFSYVFNDIVDRENDRSHPEKSKRPIACGDVGIPEAIVIAIFCLVVSLFGSYMISSKLTFVIVTYAAISVFYTLWLKNVMILDCIIIAVGFCLRAVAGAIAIGVYISPWLIVCTFTLCLFLAFGKRRSEIIILGENGHTYRKTLQGYSIDLLDHMLNVTSGLAIVCFLLYTMDSRTEKLFGTTNLVYTCPFVMYCVFRFSALIQKGRYSGPVKLIISDRPFQLGFILWSLACIFIIYADKFGLNLA